MNNGKIYVGKHYGSILDKYLGSGKILQRAIRKHGRDRFFQVILSVHLSHEEALEAERKIVTPEFVKRSDTYIMKRGGEGGGAFGNTNASGPRSPESRAAMSAAHKGNTSWLGKKHSPESRAAMSAAHKGKKFSSEHCGALSAARKGNTNGSGNKGKKKSPDHCAALSAAKKGKKNYYSLSSGKRRLFKPELCPEGYVTLKEYRRIKNESQ